jgi:hypothetical protein
MLGEDDCMGEIEETRIRELVGMGSMGEGMINDWDLIPLGRKSFTVRSVR